MKILKFRTYDFEKKKWYYSDQEGENLSYFWYLVMERGTDVFLFTGKFDINGKEIWQGDHIKTRWSSHETKYGTIVWDESGLGGWGIELDYSSKIISGDFLNPNSIEVIGDFN